ncbi:MAG TPA: D-alanine--D-alanine ligase [Candidatus Saccharimonadales bacterium]|jgi:D-alanine-D-alanine ligase
MILNAIKQKVLVLCGGPGSEREVSLRSGASVAAWLRTVGYDVITADPAESDFSLERLARECDVVFPILHGAGGEDGSLQRGLEAVGKPFLGSGCAACELTFDKVKYRQFVTGRGVRMAEGRAVNRLAFERSELRRQPYVLKPINGGSSVDTLILRNLADEPDADFFDGLFMKYPEMLLEQLIEGQELTVGVLGNRALPVILVVPPADGEFDYTNKYNGRTREIVNPAEVDAKSLAGAQELALRLHRITGCRHLSRSDMILTSVGELYVLETNTIPGLTDQSLFPKMAAAAGLDTSALARCFLEMSLGV